MKYTFLGRTGVTVSRLCLGCMSYGDPGWRSWVLDEAASRPFFRRAVEAGINFFDTADMYSLGVSEEVTGRALREFARLEECIVATKVFQPMSDRPNMGGLSRKHIVQGCETSLAASAWRQSTSIKCIASIRIRPSMRCFRPSNCWSNRAKSDTSAPVRRQHGSSRKR